MNIKHILLTFSLIILGNTAFSQITWTNGNGTGTWADDANWDAVAIPTATDDVIFDGAFNEDCTIDATVAEALTITIQNGYTGIITITNGSTLTTYGNLTVTAFGGSLVLDNGNSLTIGGALSIANSVNNNSATFTLSGDFFTGSLSAPRGTINAGSATSFECDYNYGSNGGFNISGCTFTAPSSNLNINLSGGTFANRAAGSFNANNGTVNLYFAVNKNFPSGFTAGNAFRNLKIVQNGTAQRTLTFAGVVTVNGNLTLQSSGSEGLVMNNQSISVSGNLINSSNLGNSSGAGTTVINLVGTTAQTITGNAGNLDGGNLPSITINQGSGGTIVLSGRINIGGTLTITSNGAITANSNSTLSFEGATAANLTGATSLTSISLYNLRVNKSTSLTINGSLTPQIRITNVLSALSGTLTTNGKITMASSATSTSGQIDAVTGTISGNFTVERFIPGSTGRKWRFIASPVNTSNFISNNWQQQIHITGSGSGGTLCPTLTSNANGFDPTTSNSASFYTYSESGGAWTALGNTNATDLTRGIGYRVFIRGARSQGCSLLDGSNPTPNDVTLSATGAIATGTQTINVTNGAGGGWNLVGNPFQAIVDWDNIGRTNVGTTYHVFNPNAGLGGVGAYGTYTVGGSSTNNATRYIGPGQSFWVNATGSGSIAIEEADKAVTQTSGATNLYKTSSSNGLSIKVLDANNYSDEVVVNFVSNSTKCIDASIDAEKLQFAQGVGNIATYNTCSGLRYAINSIPELTSTSQDTIGLHVKVATNTSANYRLSFDGLTAIPSNLDVYLVDAYTNTYFNLKNNSIYNFSTIANNAATQGANRFSVIIGTGLAALPVKLTNFTAARNGNTSKLAWTTATELNSKLFMIERSDDASNYKEVGVVNAKGNSSVTSSYTFNDLSPVLGANNYYRLKAVDKDGKYEYSNIQIVSFEDNMEKNTAIATSVYPMPAQDYVMLSIGNDVSGNIDYTIYDVAGNLVSEAVNMPVQANGDLRINLDPSLIGGFYIIELSDDFGNMQRIKFVKK